MTFRHGVVRSDFDLAETLKVKAVVEAEDVALLSLGQGVSRFISRSSLVDE